MKKIKNIIAVLVCFSLTSWGYNVNDKFTVETGSGVSLRYVVTSASDVSLYYCSTDNSGEVDIPAIVNGLHVTKIAKRAFFDCKNITAVSIPNSVIEVGELAFYNCSAIASVSVGTAVTQIGKNAFSNCTNITSVTISDISKWCEISFESEQSNPLYYSHNLSVNDESISHVIIPDYVTTIKDYAFAHCTNLTTIAIGNSVTTIGKSAFQDCTNLATATIGNSVTSIGNYAFRSCTGLTSVSIPNSVTSIGEYAFSGCRELTSVIIPNSVTSIGENAFYDCSGLTSIEIPSSVSNLGYAAFADCTNISGILFNEGLTEIGRSCFARCKRVVSIVLPSSLNSIGAGAFSECDSLSDVSFADNTLPLLFGNDYNEDVFKDCPIQTLYIGRKLNSRYNKYFRQCQTLLSVTINNTDDYSFQRCSNLTTVVLLDNVTIIPKSSFNNCMKLKSLRFPSNLVSIGSSAFSDCGLIDSLVIPDNVTAIGDSAFYNCRKMKLLVLGKSLSSVGSNAFKDCVSLTTAYARNISPSYIYVYGAFSKYLTFFVPYGTKDLYKSSWNYPQAYLREYYYDGLIITNMSSSENNTDSIVINYSITNLSSHEACVNTLYTTSNIDSICVPPYISGTDGTSFCIIGIEAHAAENVVLSNVQIPNTIRYIKEYAFPNCINMHCMTVPWRKPADIDVNKENFINLPDDATLYVPAGTRERYAKLSPWNKFANIVESGPISPGDIKTKYGAKATLPIYLNNEDMIAGMQFKLTLPNGVSVVTDEEGNLQTTTTERAGDMTVMSRKDPDETNSYLFVPISFTGTPISGNEGAFMNVKLKVATDMPLGTYDIKLKEISMATTEFNTLQPTEVTSELTIRDLIVGDANDDNEIDIADYSAIVANILGHSSTNFTEGAADLNEDGEVDVSDLSALAYLILHPDAGNAASKGYNAMIVGAEADNYSTMEDTDPTTYDNTLYATTATGEAGGQTTLSINMLNDIEATGYQMDIYLPDGVSFALDSENFPMAELSLARTTAKRTNTFDCSIQADGALRIICNSTGGYAFNGNDGEVATVLLDIASSLAEGNYPIVMKNIVITDATGNERFAVDLMKSTLTVGEVTPVYDENYNLQIVPFQIAAGTDDTEVELLMQNKTAGEIKSVEFDLVLPQGISLYKEDGDYVVDAGSRFATTSIRNRFACDVDNNIDGSLHVSAYFTRTTASYMFSGTSGDIALLTLVADDALAAGIYTLDIRNILFNDDNSIKVAPYKASVFVGKPKVESAVLYGNYTADAIDALNDCLSTDESLAYIDLSNAVAIEDNSEILTVNNNCVIYIPTGTILANTDNVVDGDACDNLVLTDGQPFEAIKDFTAISATYTRNVTSRYGTVCLPYAVSSDASTKYYTLDRVEGSTLYLIEQTNIAAGVPAVFERLTDSGVVSATATNANIKSSVVMPTDGELKLIGTYEKLVITDPIELAKSYYISKDQFHQATNSLTVNPFRAYFTYTGSSPSKVFKISTEDDITAIDSIGGESDDVSGIYTVDGVKLLSLQKGVNIVRYANGKTQKIIVR